MRARRPGLVDYSEAARLLWLERKPALDAQAVDPVGGAVLVRGAGHVARMALIIAMIEGHNQIEVQDLRSAFAIWDACRHSAMLLFGAMTGDRDADRIYGVLVQMGGELTRSALHDALGRHGRSADTDHALVVLASRGLIVREKRGTRGRPVERITAVDLVTPLSAESAESAESPPTDVFAHNAHIAQGGVTAPDDNLSPDYRGGPTVWEDDAPICDVCTRRKRRVPGDTATFVCTFPHKANPFRVLDAEMPWSPTPEAEG
jgi:hypothetical protein